MSEVEKKIDECINEIKPYRIYTSQADFAISVLNEIKRLVKDLNEENIQKALGIVAELYKEAQPYANFLPTTNANLKFIKDWLEKK